MKRRLIALLTALMIVGVGTAQSPARPPEQAVIVHFEYGNSDWQPFFRFEEKLEKAVNNSGLGNYDGNELAVDGSDGSLYMYGPDADRLFAFVRPFLEHNARLNKVEITLRYGAADDPNAREREVKLGT